MLTCGIVLLFSSSFLGTPLISKGSKSILKSCSCQLFSCISLKVFLSAYLPWVFGNHALRLLKIVLEDGWIVYRMRWFLELTIGYKPTRRQVVCMMYDVANRRKLMLILDKGCRRHVKKWWPAYNYSQLSVMNPWGKYSWILLQRSWGQKLSVFKWRQRWSRNVTISVEKGLVLGAGGKNELWFS